MGEDDGSGSAHVSKCKTPKARIVTSIARPIFYSDLKLAPEPSSKMAGVMRRADPTTSGEGSYRRPARCPSLSRDWCFVPSMTFQQSYS